MKTQKNSNPTLPSPVKFSIYIVAVAVLGILNWTALKASDPVSDEFESFEIRLEAALVPVAEPAIELEDWMLSFSDEVVFEAELALEDWMLTVDEIVVFEEEEFYDEELELVLQKWMLDRLEFLCAEEIETEPEVEDWMVNVDTWAKVEFMVTK